MLESQMFSELQPTFYWRSLRLCSFLYFVPVVPRGYKTAKHCTFTNIFWSFVLLVLLDIEMLNLSILDKSIVRYYVWNGTLLIHSDLGCEKTNYDNLNDHCIRLQIWKYRINYLETVFNHLLLISGVSSLNVRKVNLL